MVVGQFHDVVEIFAGAADVQDVNEPSVCARDRLKARHPLELALKRALAFEGAAINHLHRPDCSSQTSRQPDFAVSAAPDYSQHFVIRNNGNVRRGEGRLRCAVFNVVSDRADPNISGTAETIAPSFRAESRNRVAKALT